MLKKRVRKEGRDHRERNIRIEFWRGEEEEERRYGVLGSDLGRREKRKEEKGDDGEGINSSTLAMDGSYYSLNRLINMLDLSHLTECVDVGP